MLGAANVAIIHVGGFHICIWTACAGVLNAVFAPAELLHYMVLATARRATHSMSHPPRVRGQSTHVVPLRVARGTTPRANTQ